MINEGFISKNELSPEVENKIIEIGENGNKEAIAKINNISTNVNDIHFAIINRVIVRVFADDIRGKHILIKDTITNEIVTYNLESDIVNAMIKPYTDYEVYSTDFGDDNPTPVKFNSGAISNITYIDLLCGSNYNEYTINVSTIDNKSVSNQIINIRNNITDVSTEYSMDSNKIKVYLKENVSYTISINDKEGYTKPNDLTFTAHKSNPNISLQYLTKAIQCTINIITYDGKPIGDETITVKNKSTHQSSFYYVKSSNIVNISLYTNVPYEILITNKTPGYVCPDSINFTINKNEVSKQINIHYNKYHLYGILIDQDNSDPDTCVTYLHDAVGKIPLHCDPVTGECDYGSWEFTTLNNKCGSHWKIGNNYFSQFDKMYYKYSKIGNKIQFLVSDYQIDESFKCDIFKNHNSIFISQYCITGSDSGSIPNSKKTTFHNYDEVMKCIPHDYTNPYVLDYETIMYINFLIILVTKSLNVQKSIGLGAVDQKVVPVAQGDNSIIPTDQKFFGTSDPTKPIRVFNIENWWGNGGCFVNNTMHPDRGSDVIVYPGGISSPDCTTGGFCVNKLNVCNNLPLVDTESKSRGSVSTYYCDLFCVVGKYDIVFGSEWDKYSGIFNFGSASIPQNASVYFGARFCDCMN